MKRAALAGTLLLLLIASFYFEGAITLQRREMCFDVPGVNAAAGEVFERTIELEPQEHISEGHVTLEFFSDTLAGFQDLFQTADVNEGVRLELFEPARAALLIGAPNPPVGGNPLTGGVLSPGVVLKHWNHFEMCFRESGVTSTCLNGGARQYFNAGAADLHPRWRRFLIGSGFSPERKFHGQIRSAHVAITAATPRCGAMTCLLLGRALLIMPLIGLFVTFPVMSGMETGAKVRIIGMIVVAGFAVATMFHYVAGHYFGCPFPLSTFLFRPEIQFTDFLQIYADLESRDPYNPQRIAGPCQYPPFVFLLMSPATLLGAKGALFAYCIGVLSFLWLFSWHCLRGCEFTVRLQGTIILTLVTYPVLFLLDRANFEGVLFVLLALFVVAYQKKRYNVATVFLAMATAMKIIPGVLVIIFFVERKWKNAIATILLVGAFTIAGCLWLKGDLVTTLRQYTACFGTWDREMMSYDSTSAFTSTLYNFLRVTLGYTDAVECARLYSVYRLICFSVLVGLVGCFLCYERSFRRKISLLILAILLLPPMNYDYRLILLYIPLALYFSEGPGPLDAMYAVIFALLLVPKAYFNIRSWISISVVINPLLLLGLATLYVREGWMLRNSERSGESAA